MKLCNMIVNHSFEVQMQTFKAPREAPIRLNPKVIETWINETLNDAAHLDIPGVVLKPEHKNPVSRYSIDRLTLTVSFVGYITECWNP